MGVVIVEVNVEMIQELTISFHFLTRHSIFTCTNTQNAYEYTPNL